MTKIKCDTCGETYSLEIAKKYSGFMDDMDPCDCSLFNFIEKREKLIKKLRKELSRYKCYAHNIFKEVEVEGDAEVLYCRKCEGEE